MSKTNYLEEAVINTCLLGQAWPIATNPTLRMALYQGDPGEGTPANEVSGNAYARQIVTFTSTTANGVTKAANTSDIVFPVATPAGWGGAVTHFIIFANSNPIYVGELSPSQVIGLNGQLTIRAGTLQISED